MRSDRVALYNVVLFFRLHREIMLHRVGLNDSRAARNDKLCIARGWPEKY